MLIEAFRKLKGYELVLAGGLLPADKDYIRRLRLEAKNLNIRIVPNPSFDLLTRLYNASSIYWHAAGYRETNPENMEHFGISTVEAMSAGSVPVVYNGGGLPEIVREGRDGYLWTNIHELVNKTRRIITNPGKKLPQHAIARSKEFSTTKFTDGFDQLLTDITR